MHEIFEKGEQCTGADDKWGDALLEMHTDDSGVQMSEFDFLDENGVVTDILLRYDFYYYYMSFWEA